MVAGPNNAYRFADWCRLVLAAGLMLLPLSASDAQSASTAGSVAEQYLLAAANQERAALGLGRLHREPLLAKAAANHAGVMAAHGSISHQFAGEPELSARGAGAGVRFSLISENVAEAPSAVTIHEMWMHSPGHRANLLDPAVNAVGISVVARGGELYAVEDFVKTVETLGIDEQEAAVAALIAQSGVQVDSSDANVASARKTCALASGYAGARQPAFVMRFTADSLAALPGQLNARIASGKYRLAAVGACQGKTSGPFTSYNLAVMLYP